MQLIYLWLYYNINVHSLWKDNSIRLICLFCIARKSSSSGRWRRDPMFCECVSINVLPILCLILKLAEIENLWPVPTMSFSPFQTLHFEVSVGVCWAPALPATQVQRWDYGSSSFMSHIVMHSCKELGHYQVSQIWATSYPEQTEQSPVPVMWGTWTSNAFAGR